jgi:hypothetical protein
VAELLHQVEGESGFAGSDGVQETDVRVESDLFECSLYGNAQHAVQEGEQAVQRIGGGSFVAPGRLPVRVCGEQVGHGGEVVACGDAFDAEYLVGAGCGGE